MKKFLCLITIFIGCTTPDFEIVKPEKNRYLQDQGEINMEDLKDEPSWVTFHEGLKEVKSGFCKGKKVKFWPKKTKLRFFNSFIRSEVTIKDQVYHFVENKKLNSKKSMSYHTLNYVCYGDKSDEDVYVINVFQSKCQKFTRFLPEMNITLSRKKYINCASSIEYNLSGYPIYLFYGKNAEKTCNILLKKFQRSDYHRFDFSKYFAENHKSCY